MSRFFVGNIPYETTPEQLREALSEFRPGQIDMVHDKLTGRFRGYAFVEMDADFDTNEKVVVGIRNLFFGRTHFE